MAQMTMEVSMVMKIMFTRTVAVVLAQFCLLVMAAGTAAAWPSII